MTRLKWKIPRKASVSDGAISDFANRDDTTDQGSTNDLHNDAAMKILHSEAVVKLEPGMEKRVEDRVAKLEPGMEMSQRKANVCSDLHVPDNITMTLSPKTNSTYVSESLPAPRANQSDTESEKSRLHAEDTEAGPSTGFPSSSDVLEAMADDVGKHSRKQNHRRRRSKRNRRKVQLADCPNSRKVETWFDFRDIETHLGSRRRTSNTRQQQPQVPSVTQSDPYYGTSELTWLNTFAYSGHRYKHDLRDRPPLLPSPHPSHAPPLMNFVPVTSYNHTCVSGQPPLSYSSYPPGPYACPPFPPPPILGGPPPQPPPNVLPQPQVSMSYLGSSDAASACGNNVGFSTHHDQGPCVAEVQKPKIKRPNQRQRRRRKKKTKLVLTVTRKSPKKSEESSVPVTKAVLAKRRRRSQRKKRKREEWKIKKRELKEAGQWPRPKRRRDLFSPGSPRDPTYSPSKWDPKSIAQSDGCMTRARTAATNTPRKQAMREAVREAYRHEDHGEGLRFAREILAKQGRTSDTDTRRSDNTTTAGADTVESGMGNGNGYLTTPIREGSKSERPSSTPQSGYLERRGSGIGGQPRHPVASIPETPPSTVAAQYENRTRLTSDSNVTGPSTSSYERERDYCMRIVDEVKRRSLPSRRMLSSVLVTPVQKAIVMRSAASEEKSEHEKPVRDQGEGRTNSSDLIDQLCQNLDDLQNRNNIIQRDGSIVPISKLATLIFI